AILLITSGVVLMSFDGRRERKHLSGTALIYALATAAFTASHTIVDGLGARISGNASAYTMWMFVGDGVLMAFYALAARGTRAFAGIGHSWRIDCLQVRSLLAPTGLLYGRSRVNRFHWSRRCAKQAFSSRC